MTEMAMTVFALVVGLLLGLVFFGGLWWTVQRSASAKNPALWFIGSLLLRTAITLAGFYAFANGSWLRLLICMLGFLIARIVVVRFSRNPPVLPIEISAP